MCSTSRKITPNSCSTPSSHDRPQGRPVSGASCDAPIGPRAVEVGSVTIKAKAMGEQHAYRQTSSPRTRIVEFTSRRHLRCCATVLAPGSQLGRQRGASLEGLIARPLRRLPADEGVKAALYVLGINLHYVLHSTIHTSPYCLQMHICRQWNPAKGSGNQQGPACQARPIARGPEEDGLLAIAVAGFGWPSHAPPPEHTMKPLRLRGTPCMRPATAEPPPLRYS